MSEEPDFIEEVSDTRVPKRLSSDEAAVFIGAFNRALTAYATEQHAQRVGLEAVQITRKRRFRPEGQPPP